MVKLLLALLLAFAGYVAWEHPQDITRPAALLADAQESLANTVSTFPFAPQLGEETLPPGVWVATEPAMYPIQAAAWNSGEYHLRPLFGYHLRARVLSKAHYLMGREADLSPYDLALGWQQMSDSRTLAEVSVSQEGRWYHYQYAGVPPIRPERIPLESGNMHIIPGNDDILRSLRRVHKGNIIELAGYLVEITAPDHWHWLSGTSDTGEGQGSCKVIWVTLLKIER